MHTTLDDVLSASGFLVATPGGADPEVIALYEAMVGAQLPATLRWMYTTRGAVDCGPVRLLGLGVPVGHPADALDALAELGEADGPFFPLERRAGRRLAAAAPDGSVWTLGAGGSDRTADTVETYVMERIERLRRDREREWNELRGIGRRFAERFDAVGTSVPNGMPRANDWRPVRFCIQDVILGVVAMRFDRQINAVRVGPFVFTDTEGVPPGTGAEALTAIVVAEAYRCGGDLRVRFERGVPDGVLRTAENLGVELADESELAAEETRQLLVRFSGIGPALDQAGLPDALVESIASQVLRSNWTALEVQLLLACGDPGQRILAGGSRADWRLARIEELELCRSAILAQALRKRIRAPEMDAGTESIEEHEDAARDVDVEVMGGLGRGVIVLDARERVAVPWLRGQSAQLLAGDRCVVLVRGRGRAGLVAWAERDAAEAARLAQLAGASVAAVLYPRDAEEFDLDAAKREALIMIAPQPANVLDRAVVSRMRAASREDR